MNRAEAIQRIVWCLLRHADTPNVAVAAAATLQDHLGDGHERQMTFTNLLRAAGLFAKDDDGYFMRYRNAGANPDNSFLDVPQPNYLLTFPVPAEPRMRVAYSVFTGLLLKYLYQTYGAVPTEVSEGMARLVASQPLPDSDNLWREFKQSEFVAQAVSEGLEATLGAIGGIGGIDVTETMADSALLKAFLTVLPRFGNKFQKQGGMRLDFYFVKDVDEWLAQQNSAGNSSESLADLWRRGWQEGSSPDDVAKQIAARIVRDVKSNQPLPARTFETLWTGEGSGASRKQGRRDNRQDFPPPPDAMTQKRAKQVDNAVVGLLSQLDAKRRDTRTLHQWIKSKLNAPQHRKWVDKAVAAIQAALTSDTSSKHTPLDAGQLLDSIVKEFQAQTVVPSLRKDVAGHNREVRSAIQQSAQWGIAIRLAEKLGKDASISIFGWRVETLLSVPSKQEWALRFLKKRKPTGGKRIVEVTPFGDIERLEAGASKEHGVPFQCFALDDQIPPASSEPLFSKQRCIVSKQRCIVCGSPSDLMAGAKSFLPEAKKRHYDAPTRKESPSLCSNCAFIAYLSSVYPSSDLSIVEFPADNFLELFALYESLQGVSALVALKYVNRVASLSVLPNRYLLLSHNDRTGRLDAKAQVYLQLREQTHLLKHVDRPMHVQIEGGIPQMWSEIQPHIPIGLSHFKELPPHYETQDSARKGFAYEVVRALQAGQPYKALYVAAKHADDNGHPFERRVFTKNLKAYETFVSDNRRALAKSLGGETVSNDIYQDIKEFSNQLFDLLYPLVRREVQKSKSSVSGIARKYTDLIKREFGEGMAGKFLYTVCQEADSAERDGDGWVKHKVFTKLYGDRPDTKGKTDEEKARAWEEFRKSHPVQMEERLRECRDKYGKQHAIWEKFLREVQARTLALLMLNVRQSS
jgi:hypothetical protein